MLVLFRLQLAHNCAPSVFLGSDSLHILVHDFETVKCSLIRDHFNICILKLFSQDLHYCRSINRLLCQPPTLLRHLMFIFMRLLLSINLLKLHIQLCCQKLHMFLLIKQLSYLCIWHSFCRDHFLILEEILSSFHVPGCTDKEFYAHGPVLGFCFTFLSF